MTIDLTNVPLHVSVRAGEKVEFELPSYSGSGNYWRISQTGNPAIALTVIELRPISRSTAQPSGTAEPPPLVLSPEFLVVSGIRQGTTKCELVLQQSFGQEDPAATHTLEIVVSTAQ